MDNKLAVYSNRPPVNGLAGGAVRVIGASKPNFWIGPSDKAISDEVWATMSDAERHKLTPHIVDGITVYTFPVPKSLQDGHYRDFANGVIWPIMHSMDPKTFFNPGDKSDGTHYFFKRKADDVKGSYLEYVESSYLKYQALNDLANAAIKQLKDNGAITNEDLIWVHDYQCLNVQGDAFSRHIPFPSVSYLEKVRFDSTPLLETEFFKDYMRHYSQHPLISFQRPVDMTNFIETLARLDQNFHANNPDLVNERGLVARNFPIGKESLTSIRAFGNRLSILNVPVGISQEENLREAIENEDGLKTTQLRPDRLQLTGLHNPGGDPDIPVMVDNPFRDSQTLKEVLGSALEPGHRMIVSVGRNDYTKNTLEKIDAAAQFFIDHPEEVGKTHFVYVVAPTRSNVAGYKEYEDQVLAKAKSLHQRYGDSMIVIPEALAHEDIMGLFRHPNTTAAIGVGLKDGHDLTVREAVDARADGKVPPVAVIMTDGIGASDILGGSHNALGAFVINTNGQKSPREYLTANMAGLFDSVVAMGQTADGRKELAYRYEVMRDASAMYTATHFGRTVTQAAQRRKEFDPQRAEPRYRA